MDFESIVQISAFGHNQSDVTAFRLNARCPPPACRRSRLPANHLLAKVLDALIVQARVPRLAFLCSAAYRASLSASLVRAAGCPPYVPRRHHAKPDARAHTVAVLVHRATCYASLVASWPLRTICKSNGTSSDVRNGSSSMGFYVTGSSFRTRPLLSPHPHRLPRHSGLAPAPSSHGYDPRVLDAYNMSFCIQRAGAPRTTRTALVTTRRPPTGYDRQRLDDVPSFPFSDALPHWTDLPRA
ncbi:hypothetical protein B0H14DRAFT_3449162 [Mycena olivaceomarginata]|nr:hypothetical protein B0H14DRAFT_3449162 [Mycena olivaceomarginata]